MAFSAISFMFPIMSAISLYFVGRLFATSVSAEIVTNDLEATAAVVIENYKSVKRLSDLMSKCMGWPIACYYCICVSYWMRVSDLTEWNTTIGQTVLMTYMIVTSPVLWIVAAEFHKTVRESMLQWLDIVTGHTSKFQVQLVDTRNSCLLDPPALSCRFFTITYSFISSVSFLLH